MPQNNSPLSGGASKPRVTKVVNLGSSNKKDAPKENTSESKSWPGDEHYDQAIQAINVARARNRAAWDADNVNYQSSGKSGTAYDAAAQTQKNVVQDTASDIARNRAKQAGGFGKSDDE